MKKTKYLILVLFSLLILASCTQKCEHVEYEWVVDKNATCEETGLRHKECKNCNEKFEEEEIPALGHTESDWIIDKAPTCTEMGTRHTVCTVCNKTITQESIYVIEHDLVYHEAKDPTCTEVGNEEYYTCKNCSYTTYEEIEILDHIKSDWIIDQDPTCTENGLKHIECVNCHQIFDEENIDALGHIESDWIIDKAPTCTASGYKHTECVNCHNYTYQSQSIDALGHDKVHHEAFDPTCTVSGNYAYDTCTRCSYTTYKEISALGHTESDFIIDIKPTCEKEGLEHTECVTCHQYEFKEIVMDALGHDWHNGICSNCKEKVNKIYENENGKYIYFGYYPQTLKKDAVKIDENAESNADGYYLGSDGELYAKVTASVWGSDKIYFANHSQIITGETYYFKVEPIKWTVVETANSYKLISTLILDASNFDIESNVYESSKIKTWLNTTFLNKTFTSELQNMFVKGTDKVTLLSKEEVTDNLSKQLTDFAKAKGCIVNTTDEYYNNGIYWLSTSNESTTVTSYTVNYDGSVNGYSYIGYNYIGVVPNIEIAK